MKNNLITVVLSIFCMTALAQASADTTSSAKQTIYMLPDGSILGSEKLDSLMKAWGSVSFMHSKEDDVKGIIHVVKESDEMKRQLEAESAKRKKVIASMLNKPAPEFKLTDLQGKHWTLKKLHGKIVILNFWFTTCAPCIQEMPELNKLVQENDSNLVFLALTFDDAEQVNSFLQKRTFSYTQLPNSSVVDKKYHVNSWPTSIVIDKKGDIKMIVGSSRKIREELAAVINSLK